MNITIAMATYNGANYIKEQLDSFVAQTRLPDELIVCDDASSDETVAILMEFARTCPFKMRMVRNEKNLGYTKNFEKALSLCEGDIIFLSDQDDVWFSNKLEVIEKLLISNPEVMVVLNNMDICDENLQITGLTTLGQVRSARMKDQVLSYGCCTAFRSSLKPLILPIPHSYSHDVWINQFGKSMNRWHLVEASLQLYRRHNSTSSNWITSSGKKLKRQNLKSLQVNVNSWIAYKQRATLLLDVKKRLVGYASDFLPYSENTFNISQTIDHLNKEIKITNARTHLLRTMSFRRKILALKLLLSGGYRYFSGLKSFLKDFLF